MCHALVFVGMSALSAKTRHAYEYESMAHHDHQAQTTRFIQPHLLTPLECPECLLSVFL
jgi:hypothetical protein